MRQIDLWGLLHEAAIADSPAEAQEFREKFLKAISALDSWTQCIMLDLYDEVLRRCPEELPRQMIFYMYCGSSRVGTTEHGLGVLEPEVLL
ncbi:MAG: hypothetical protein AAB351_02840 [Patescibacteria group bacterium]